MVTPNDPALSENPQPPVARSVLVEPSITLSHARSPELKSIIRQLRCRAASPADILRPLLQIHEPSTAPKLDEAAAPFRETSQILLDAISERYGALDAAVRESIIPFVEVDGHGNIAYANAAFLELAPDEVGKPFARLFGPRAPDVEAQIATGRGASMRLELFRDGQLISQLRVELGPLRDEHGLCGAFALLLDVQAEERRYADAPYGIVRINSDQVITYANAQAVAMIGVSRAELLGRPAASIFRPAANGDEPADDLGVWLQKTEGQKTIADLVQPLTGAATPVRVAVLPSYHMHDRRAGTVLTFASVADELARKKLQKLLATNCAPEDLVRGTMRAIRKLVPYDLATFGIYTEDMKFFRVLAADPPQNWKIRWFPVDEETIPWIRSGKSYAPDLDGFLQAHAPSAMDEPVVIAIRAQGLKSLLALPISRGGDQFRSALSLLSLRKAAYGEIEYEALRGLGVLEALTAAENAFERRRDGQLQKLKHDLTTATDARNLANLLATGIVEIFHWDYVSIFKVDRAKDRFELLTQHDATPDGCLTVDRGYTQPIDKGLLHFAFKEGKALIVPDAAAKPAPYGFFQTLATQASAMAIPVKVAGRTEWIVDVESTDRNAFQGPDLEALQELVTECEEALDQRWHGSLKAILLDAAEQALVVVDAAGTVRQTNLRANQLFEISPGNVEGMKLASYGAEAGDKEILSSVVPGSKTHLKLQLPSGVRVPVLVTERPLNDDYGHRLFIFTDLRDPSWQHEWRYLEETVNEVARHTRIPLLVVGSLVRRVVAEPSILGGSIDLLNQAIKQLAKADITYERLADTLAARQEPDQGPQTFDVLQAVRDAVASFPDTDTEDIDMQSMPDTRFPVEGWPDRLGFVLRSLLSRLLVLRSTDGKVQILGEVNTQKGLRLTLHLEGTDILTQAGSRESDDPLAACEHKARQTANLAPETIRAIIEQHKGRFELNERPEGGLEFHVMFEPR